MKARVTVEVTQADINAGKRKSKTCCPLALALYRISYLFRDGPICVVNPVVMAKTVVFAQVQQKRGRLIHYEYGPYKLPPIAVEFQYNYDHFRAVAPITFEVEYTSA